MHHLCGLTVTVSHNGTQGIIIDVMSSVHMIGGESRSYHILVIMFDDGSIDKYYSNGVKLNPNEVITKLFLSSPKISK